MHCGLAGSGLPVMMRISWLEGVDNAVDTYIHTYIHTYIQTYTHTYIHTYLHTYLHIDIHTHTHGRTCVHACIHPYLRACIHTYTRTHTNAMTKRQQLIRTIQQVINPTCLGESLASLRLARNEIASIELGGAQHASLVTFLGFRGLGE